MGTLIDFGGMVSAFGASLACTVGASRILFALGRDTGPAMLRRTSRRTGALAGMVLIRAPDESNRGCPGSVTAHAVNPVVSATDCLNRQGNGRPG